MFSLSKLNLQSKKNSRILISDFKNGSTFAMLAIYESSTSSDTDHFTFIQQNSVDGSIKIKKLVWISESTVYSIAINCTCDWLAVSLRGGVICILPLGALMGRVQKRCEHWKTNDVTYLHNKIRRDSTVTCMKWWTSSKNKNTCLIGTSNGDFLIIDLANGSSLYTEQFNDHIQSIDLLLSVDGIFSYIIVSSKSLVQWKLLLEEVHNKEAMFDKEFGFEALDLSIMNSTSILESKSTKKSKGEKHVNPAYEPTKFYQFSESTYLKSQSCNGKHFIGAYDRCTGKYKLFDCSNLDSSLYEFQLPLHVLDICVTEDLIFLIVESVPKLHLSDGGMQSVFQDKTSLKLCAICRQYAQSHLFEKYHTKVNNKRSSGLFKPSNEDTVPLVLQRSVIFEFELANMYSSADVVGLINFPFLFNLFDCEKMNFLDVTNASLKNTKGLEFIKQMKGRSPIIAPNKEIINSKWLVDEIKQFTPLFLIERTGISICHLSQCYEDKFIDYLLSNDTSKAEWLGASLRLDMNYLYQYTAQLLLSGNAQLNPSVKKSKKTIIMEFFDLGNTSIRNKLTCITQFWPVEDCLQFSLTLASQINNISPADRSILSNSLIPMFGYVISDPVDVVDGVQNKKKKYIDKFRRFVVSNCFFNDFKAAKIMIGFGLVDEAFFIAKEKGCVVELFKFLMENNYNTNWWKCFNDFTIQDMYSRLDMNFVLTSIGLMDLEIVARSDPKLLKSFAEFICERFMTNISDLKSLFSFQTTTHLCLALNPQASIINSLFHIYSYTTSNDSGKNEIDLSALFDKSPSSSTESLTGTATFSKTLKIRREIGPELLAFCLLVILRDNQINDSHDHIYFIQLYGIITSTVSKRNQHVKDDINCEVSSQKKDSINDDLFATTLPHSNFKSKKNLSTFWLRQIKPQCLALRNDLCISISVFDLDLFEDELLSFRKSKPHPKELIRKKTNFDEPQNRHRCQINMLGFQKDKSSRVLLLPKSIESGKEIIRQVALGKRHVLILTDCGSLYGAGSNVYGQLGVEKSLVNETSINRKNCRLNVINPQPVNIKLKKSEIIVSVAAGDFHSGAIIVDSENALQKSYVATWGWGVHGQLGHGDIDTQLFPRILCFDIDNSGGLPDEESKDFPIQLAMGCYHSILLTNKGNVYTFGNNSYGQLGKPGIQKSLRPLLIHNLPPNVTIIDTKYFHTVCCTKSNEILTWGIDPNLWQNQFNQNKLHSYISTPITIPTENLLLNEKVVQISCGTSHTTILTESKLVYSFGANMWGQLGLGNRKEYSHLVEVKMPKPIDFISSDNGVTVGMHIGDKSTKLILWGRCSHPLVQENIKELSTDTVKPQLLIEYQHSLSSNLMDPNCFDIDSLSNSGYTILNKHQLMIFFRNCSKYLDQNELMNSLRTLKEFDVIADFYLINDMLIESFFWRIKSLNDRIVKVKEEHDYEVIKEDIEIMFQFYLRVSEKLKNQKLTKAIITMLTGYFKTRKLPWKIYERICSPIISKFPEVISKLVVKLSLEDDLSSGFLSELLLNTTEENSQEYVVRPTLGSIVLLSTDIQRFHDLIRTGNSETIYDAADDHKVVFFANCGHAAVLGRYREQQLKVFVDKLRRKQLNFSIQMIQRLYSDSTILPDCLECLSQRI